MDISEKNIVFNNKFFDGKIMKSSPLVLKLFLLLLNKLKDSDNNNLDDGSVFTTIECLRQNLSYETGCVLKSPTKKEIKTALEKLQNIGSLVTTLVTGGIVVSIVDYSQYYDTNATVGNAVGNGRDAKRVFDVWNNAGIIKHRDVNKYRKNINHALTLYSVDEISSAINNYSLVLLNDEYYWTYRWNLKDFLLRGIDRFVPENFCVYDYLAKKSSTQSIIDSLSFVE